MSDGSISLIGGHNELELRASQAFFSPPENKVVATIYSPREFFGMPYEGLTVTRMPLEVPKRHDADSFRRMSYLLRRPGDSPEAGCAAFQGAEESLKGIEPERMSRLTRRILSSVDYDNASIKRSKTFSFAYDRLTERNNLTVDCSRVIAPLCYPFLTTDPGLRERLVASEVFVPTYRPVSIGQAKVEWAKKMLRKLLPLPIDQRYGTGAMERIASVILGYDA